MNKISIYSLLLTFVFIVSCENPLDRTQLGVVNENSVWNSETLIDLQIGNLYNRCEFMLGGDVDLDGHQAAKLVANSCAAGYCRTFGGWPAGYKFTQGLFTNQGTGSNVMEYWKYDLVRDINDGIQRLEDPSEELETEFVEKKLGELHFLRAWVYMEMVKRYGGMPIIKVPQDKDAPIEELRVPRNSEEESYDFIIAECDSSYSYLTGKTMDYGRASEWAALALKSRAALFAGSIGEFGEMQLDGLLGISDPDKFWTIAYNTSKKIIADGGFSLYGMDAEDKETMYYELFTKASDNGGHSEVIMAEIFDGGGSKFNNWERWNAPELVGGTTFFNTYLETFEMYEYKDGASGKLDRSTLVEGVFHDMADFIDNKDPRCQANIFLPECTYLGQTVYLHEGMYVDGVYYNDNGTLKAEHPDLEHPAMGFPRDVQRTGMFNKKRSNENYDVAGVMGLGGNDYIIFRLGEIYLNLAEAAYALEEDVEALEALNMVRRRVAMPDKVTIDWPTIQNERAVELCFEDQHYWDLRRWRTAEIELDRRESKGNKYTGLRWRKDYNNEGMYEIVLTTTGTATDSWDRIFEPHHYYFPISEERTVDNPAMVENPGY